MSSSGSELLLPERGLRKIYRHLQAGNRASLCLSGVCVWRDKWGCNNLCVCVRACVRAWVRACVRACVLA